MTASRGDDVPVASFGCGREPEASDVYPQHRDQGLLEWLDLHAGAPLLRVVSHGQADSADCELSGGLGARVPLPVRSIPLP